MPSLLIINRASPAARFPRAAVSAVARRALYLWPRRLKGKTIAVALVSKSESRGLNKTYRGRNKETNVLSFAGEAPGEAGDIIICYEAAKREAHSAGIKTEARIRELFIHGLLHLLGFDHQNRGQTAAMRRAEFKLGFKTQPLAIKKK